MLQKPLQPPRRLHEPLATSLPDDLVRAIDRLEERLAQSGIEKKIAAFDLDNTLLVGDIGEAVFASLRVQGYVPGLTWEFYRKLVAADSTEAYKTLVCATAGLAERLIQRTTLDIISRNDDFLELEGSFVPIPSANRVMAELVARLRALGYQICTITASNEISARIVAWKFFNIPPSYVFGVRQESEDGILTRELIQPLSIGSGKTEVYRKFMGATAPVVTASDSLVDVQMLKMTDPRGLTLWVGEERIGFEVARRKIGGTQDFCFIARREPLQIDEQRLDRRSATDDR